MFEIIFSKIQIRHFKPLNVSIEVYILIFDMNILFIFIFSWEFVSKCGWIVSLFIDVFFPWFSYDFIFRITVLTIGYFFA